MKLTYKKSVYQRGFTIVELTVAVTIATIMIGVIVGTILAFTQQFAIANVRQNLNTNAQSAIARINDDIRDSTGISYYNANQDSNAPTALTGAYMNVPGPSGSNTQSYNWRFGPNRLILLQPARDANGKVIYTNPTLFEGPKNTIVYYVKNGSLYRRLISASGNAVPTITCPQETDGGCTRGTRTDTKVISDLSTVDGSGSFVIDYINEQNTKITLGTTGDPSADYSSFSNTRLLSVTLSQKKKQTGTALLESKSSNVGFRSQPTKQVAEKPFFNYSVLAGPGGINGNWNAKITGLNAATQGGLKLDFSNLIGAPTSPSSVIASNMGCGNNENYGTVQCSAEPVDMSWNAKIYGNVCARGQVRTQLDFSASIEPGNPGTQYDKGLLPSSCGPPQITMPKFNKSAMVASMTAGTQNASSASCDGASPSIPDKSDIQKNTTYTGDLKAYWNCEATLHGNVYIKGSLLLSFGSKLIVGEDVTTRPVVLVNGPINLYWNAIVQPNTKNIAPLFISFDSSNDKCSNSNSCDSISKYGFCPITVLCTALSNSELQDSVRTVDAISIGYGASAPLSLFYSYFSNLQLKWNGEIRAGAVAGQRIEFTFGSSIILDQ